MASLSWKLASIVKNTGKARLVKMYAQNARAERTTSIEMPMASFITTLLTILEKNGTLFTHTHTHNCCSHNYV